MGGSLGLGAILIILVAAWVFLLFWMFRPPAPKFSQLIAFLMFLGVSAALGYLFYTEVLDKNPNPIKVWLAHNMSEDKFIDLGYVVPGVFDHLDYVERIDTDVKTSDKNEESAAPDEWLVFYKYDVVNAGTAWPGGPYGATIYEPDGCRPPSILAFELVPVSYDYLGEDQVSVRVENIIRYRDPQSNLLDRPEVVITGRTRGVVTDVNIFRKVGLKVDYCQTWRQEGKPPTGLLLTSPFSYQNIGSFRGNYRVWISNSEADKSTVTTWDRGGFERSQLTIRRQYRPGDNGSYFRSDRQELWDPVEYSLDFGPGQPDLVSQVYYPEKAVLAFYLNLTKDEEQLKKANGYLSPTAQDVYDIESDPFGLAVPRKDLARVLVWEIRYHPDIGAEQEHQDREVVVTVVGVDKYGNIDRDHPCQVTWRIIGVTNPQALPYGCEWRLDSYRSSCQP